MSDFLSRLVTRSSGAAPTIQPRLPSLFEATRWTSESVLESETIAERQTESGAVEIAAPSRPSETPAPNQPSAKLPTPSATLPAAATLPSAPARVPTHASKQPADHQPPLPSPRSSPVRWKREIGPTRIAEYEVKATSESRVAADLRVAPPVGRERARVRVGQSQPAALPVRPGKRTPDAISTPQIQAPAAPVVHVTIGRVEVRAVTTPAPAGSRATVRRLPTLALEEYLKQPTGGRR